MPMHRTRSPCCARAASGHAAAAPMMNSRRLTARCLPVLRTERIAHLGTADCCIHPPGRNEMIAITPPIISSKEVAQKQATPFPRQDLLTARNRFTPSFRGWRLNEFSIFARPPPRGPLAHAGTRGIPSDGRCRAGPLICLGRAGDACVVGALERVGDTLYGARVYVKLGRRLAHAHAARQSCSDSLSQLVRDRRPAKSFTFTLGPL